MPLTPGRGNRCSGPRGKGKANDSKNKREIQLKVFATGKRTFGRAGGTSLGEQEGISQGEQGSNLRVVKGIA